MELIREEKCFIEARHEEFTIRLFKIDFAYMACAFRNGKQASPEYRVDCTTNSDFFATHGVNLAGKLMGYVKNDLEAGIEFGA